MTYSKESLEKLAASNREDIAKWERGADLPRLRHLADEMKRHVADDLAVPVRVRVSQPLGDGMPRLRAMYRRSQWPTMSKVKSEYRRRRRQGKS